MDEFSPKPFGRFFLIEKLATGGRAEIYKAKTYGVDGFEKLLAIKRILPHVSNDKEFIDMLVSEAKLSVLLSHTNIVQVYDLGKVGDDYFISMEYINGINLREFLTRAQERSEPLGEETVVYIVSEMAKGLDYAHSKKDNEAKPLNIVHRDISPQNILISFEGEVKIVDFGIAKAAMNISHTMAGILKGKISYMSPEQALGKPVDRRTDIYSVGLIFYELLTGEKFFTGETQFEVLKKIRTTRITENSFPDSMGPGLRKILAKALAYSTKDRYENAGDLQIDLTRYLYSTYIDFTPRKLSHLMNGWFADEIEKKTEAKKEELSIDSKTRSLLIEATSQENLVHRSDEGGAAGKQPTQTFLEPELQFKTPTPTKEAVTGPISMEHTPRVFDRRTEQKRKSPLGWAFLFVALLAIAAGVYFKTDLFKKATTITGVLQIYSTPEGAQVYINDSETNLLTPATIRALEVGKTQTITLKKPRFKDWSRSVTLVDPNPVTINPTLEVIPVGSIKVTTNPPGAKILVDGKDTGKTTPATVEDLPLSKTYSIKLELDKYRPVEEKITLYSIEPVDFSKKLEEIQYGSIRVTSNPSGAKIYLNNDDTGTVTPGVIPNIEVGKRYNLRLSKTGFQDVFRTIELNQKQMVNINESLKKFETGTPPTTKETPTTPTTTQKEPPKKTPTETPKKEPTESSGGDSFVSLSTNPKGADIFINGVRQGSSSGKFKVSANSPVEITVTKTGLATVTKVVNIRPGETRNLGTIELKGSEGVGILFIDSNPPGALVLLNGQPQKSTPLRIKGLRPQTEHTITVKKDGYEAWTKSVTIEGGTQNFMANLKKL